MVNFSGGLDISLKVMEAMNEFTKVAFWSGYHKAFETNVFRTKDLTITYGDSNGLKHEIDCYLEKQCDDIKEVLDCQYELLSLIGSEIEKIPMDLHDKATEIAKTYSKCFCY